MRLKGKFNWSVDDNDNTIRNIDGEEIIKEHKLSNVLYKVELTCHNEQFGDHDYIGEIKRDSNDKTVYTLFEKDNEIVRVEEVDSIVKSRNFNIVSDLGNYKIDINLLKTKAVLKKDKDVIMSCSFNNRNYDMIIEDNVDPVFVCSVFYGVALLMHL